MYAQPAPSYAPIHSAYPPPQDSSFGGSGEGTFLALAIGGIVLLYVAGGVLGGWMGASIARRYAAPTAVRWGAALVGFAALNPVVWMAGIRRLFTRAFRPRPVRMTSAAPGLRR